MLKRDKVYLADEPFDAVTTRHAHGHKLLVMDFKLTGADNWLRIGWASSESFS
jgi:hypothetical protein